jgi:hypothetical protein
MRTAIALSLFALALAIHGCKPADNSSTATNPPENSAITNSPNDNTVASGSSEGPKATIKVDPNPIMKDKVGSTKTSESVAFHIDDVKPYFKLLAKEIPDADPAEADDIAARISELKPKESIKADLKGADGTLRISAEYDSKEMRLFRFFSSSTDLIKKALKTIDKLPKNN